MFIGGGISAFFEDLYYRAVEKAFEITHPDCWESIQKNISGHSNGEEHENETMNESIQKAIERAQNDGFMKGYEYALGILQESMVKKK